MNIVLDTSAAVHMVLGQAKAERLREVVESADWVFAPDLFVCEVTNAFWKYHKFQKLPLPECEKFLSETLLLPDDLFPARDLSAEAFSFSCLTGHPSYDIFFLVLSRRYNAPLLTLDASLREIARLHAIKTVDIP